jgi:hypothetical protein
MLWGKTSIILKATFFDHFSHHSTNSICVISYYNCIISTSFCVICVIFVSFYYFNLHHFCVIHLQDQWQRRSLDVVGHYCSFLHHFCVIFASFLRHFYIFQLQDQRRRRTLDVVGHCRPRGVRRNHKSLLQRSAGLRHCVFNS